VSQKTNGVKQAAFLYNSIKAYTSKYSNYLNYTYATFFSSVERLQVCPPPRLAALGAPRLMTGLPVLQVGWGSGRLFSHAANDSSTSNCTAGKLLRSSAHRTEPSRGGSKERVVTYFT